jgi:hypothetical protein
VDLLGLVLTPLETVANDRFADAKPYFWLPPRNDAAIKPASAAITIRPSWTSEPPEVSHGKTVVMASGLTTGHGMHKAPSRIRQCLLLFVGQDR